MTFDIGDVVYVSDEGRDTNYSGRARVVKHLGAGWVEVEWISDTPPGGFKTFEFNVRRLTLVKAAWPVTTGAEKRTYPILAPEETIKPLDSGPSMLDFDSGANRNRKENELQYEGFISPLALQMFAEYMHENRRTADGGTRASDNWQKGIPDESYRDSLLRHIVDIWMVYRGWDAKARDGGDKRKALAGAFFNLQGLMHNLALEGLGDETAT